MSVRREDGTSVVPHVLELPHGIDRNIWGLADVGISTDNDRTVWKIPSHLAPISVGVFPLIKKEHASYARELAQRFRALGVSVEYQQASSIGKRYARMDEVGTPFCLTVDGSTVDPGRSRPRYGDVAGEGFQGSTSASGRGSPHPRGRGDSTSDTRSPG